MRALRFIAGLIVAAIASACWFRSVNLSDLPSTVTILSIEEAEKAIPPCSRSGPEGVQGFFEATQSEVLRAEQRLPGYINSWFRRSLSYDLTTYYRQYLGFRTAEGRFLYVNAFSVDLLHPFFEDITPRWRTKHIEICDGGDLAWGAEFNLQTDRFRNLRYNATIGEPPGWYEAYIGLVPREYRDDVMMILFIGTGVICSVLRPQRWVRTTLLFGSTAGVVLVSLFIGAPDMFNIAEPRSLALVHFYMVMLVVGLVFSGGLLVHLFRIVRRKVSDGV